MADNEVKIIVIGVVEILDGEAEIRFRREDNGTWKPDLMVNHVKETVTEPPTCFTPTREVIDKLDTRLLEVIAEIVADKIEEEELNDLVGEMQEAEMYAESPDPDWMNE